MTTDTTARTPNLTRLVNGTQDADRLRAALGRLTYTVDRSPGYITLTHADVAAALREAGILVDAPDLGPFTVTTSTHDLASCQWCTQAAVTAAGTARATGSVGGVCEDGPAGGERHVARVERTS